MLHIIFIIDEPQLQLFGVKGYALIPGNKRRGRSRKQLDD